VTRTTYLVERYWPGVSEDLVTEAHGRLATATARLRGEGKRVRLTSSILIPKEESVFSLLEAVSEDAAAEVNRRAGVPFDRILEVTTVAAVATERGSS
jgi:hypothetical protein